MNQDSLPYMIPFLVSCALNTALAVYGLAHRRTRGVKELVAGSLVAAFWAIVNAMELTATNLQSLLFWSNFRYIGYMFAPLCWLFLVLKLNGQVKYLNGRTILVLSALPVILCLVVGIIFTVLGFLIAATGHKGSHFKHQSKYFWSAFSLYFFSLFLYTTGLLTIKHHDFSSIVYGFSQIVLWWGLSRRRLFQVPAVARSTVFEQMADGIFVVDGQWSLIDSNESARTMFGLLSPGPVGTSLREALPTLAPVTDLSLEGIARQEVVLRVEQAAKEGFIELNVSRLVDPRHEASWVIIAKDVTDLKRARERITHQREELATAAERDRLSQELHDTLGQVLSFAVIQTDTARREMGKTNYARADSYMATLQEILRGTHEDLRGFVRGLRASEYQSVAFSDLLEKEAERFRQSGEVEVSVNMVPHDIDFSSMEKTHLAGIVKEALNNIAKHAKASRVAIDFAALPEGYRLTIEDDGVGLAAAGAQTAAGSGLSIMKERAESISGELGASTKAEGGTRLVVSWRKTPEGVDENTYC